MATIRNSQPPSNAPSLAMYLMVRVLPVALGLAVLIGFAIFHQAETQIRDNIRSRLIDSNNRGREVIDQRMATVFDQMLNLAANSVVVNGLIDHEGRDRYLTAYFHSLKLAAVPHGVLTLTNYKGVPIVTSHRGDVSFPFKEKWLTASMKENRIWHDLSDNGLTIAMPVRVNDLPEGVILLQVPAHQMTNVFNIGFPGENNLVYDGAGRILATTDVQLGRVGALFTALDPVDWISVSTPLTSVADARFVSILASKDALASLDWIRNSLILMTLSMLLMIAWSVGLSASSMGKPINQLHGLIRAIRSADDVTERIEITGPKEIRELEGDFNRMLESLENTTVSRNYLDSIINSTTYGIVTIDDRGRIITLNPAALKTFGYVEDDVIGQDVSILLPENERADHRKYVENSTLFGQRIIDRSRDLLGRRKDGTLFPMELTVSPLTVHGKRGFIGFLRDISDRKQAEQALAASESRLRKIVETSSAGFGYIDWETRAYSHVNQALCDLLGYEMDDLIGRRSLELMHPESQEFFHQQLDKIPSTDQRVYEVTMIRKDGSNVHVRFNARTVFDDEGAPIGAFAFYTDLTDIVETQERLSEAHRAAEEATRAKSAFLANMSHEIRTPMNGVIGMLELLRGTRLDRDQIHYVDTAIRSADMQMAVINDVLDYSKIEAGKLELEKTRFDPSGLMEEIATLMSATAMAKGLEMTCFCDPNLPGALLGDPTRLRQILVNLVGNAIKFTDRGEVNLSAEFHANGIEGILVEFRVRDTGIGIDSDSINRLFHPFAQADSSTTRKYGGTGLGLMISKSLVEAMGGDINVTSIPGQETVFSFRVPFKILERYRPVSVDDIKETRILVVDDNATNREILETYLNNWGIDATLVERGNDAIAAIRAATEEGNPFGLALLDYQMPEMDGVQLARLLKESGATETTRLVLLSSAQMPPANTLRQAGIGAWVAKPITQSRLLDVLVGAQTNREFDPVPEAGTGPSETILTGTVLLVEDTYINQQVALGMISRWGIRLDIANNGLEALQKTARQAYDLILMDVQMPEMDGFEATARLREREQESGARPTPIVAMTAHGLEGDRERCLAAGMDDYLAKPFRADTLKTILSRWLPETRQEATAAAAPVNEGDDNTPTADKIEADREDDIEATKAAVLDMDQVGQLRETLGALPGGFEQVVENYLETMPQLLDDLNDAVEQGDLETLLATSHNIKSNSALMGAPALSEAAAFVERQAKRSTFDGVDEMLPRLRTLYAEAEEAIRALDLVEPSTAQMA